MHKYNNGLPWYRMTRPLFNSGFEDDEFWAYGVDGFNEVLDGVIGKNVFVYDKRIYKEPQTVRAIVQNVTSDVITNTYIRQILCNIGVLKCGQYIRIGDDYWLVSSFPDNNGIYEKAVLWKCRYSVKFVSPITGEIVEYPTYSYNSTQYGTGESYRPNITVSESQHLIFLPYNEETVLLDTRFRFIMDRNTEHPSVFRITQVDTTSNATGHNNENGIIQWSCVETQFNEETDSKEFMVADYYKKESTPPTSESNDDAVYRIAIHDMDGDCLLPIGTSKELMVECYDAENRVTDLIPYSISITQNGNAISISEQSPGRIIVTANDDYDFVGSRVVIQADSDDGSCIARIELQITNW